MLLGELQVKVWWQLPYGPARVSGASAPCRHAHKHTSQRPLVGSRILCAKVSSGLGLSQSLYLPSSEKVNHHLSEVLSIPLLF